jgi:hypothetical protein
MVLCAWGTIPYKVRPLKGRVAVVLATLKTLNVKPMALKVTPEGRPYHPLYLPYDLAPIPLPGF